jgi:hypothetical protein
MRNEMQWIKISDQDPDENKVQFLTNGRTVFVKGTKMQPFLLQLYGEYITISEFKPSHWTTLPDLPGQKIYD